MTIRGPFSAFRCIILFSLNPKVCTKPSSNFWCMLRQKSQLFLRQVPLRLRFVGITDWTVADPELAEESFKWCGVCSPSTLTCFYGINCLCPLTENVGMIEIPCLTFLSWLSGVVMVLFNQPLLLPDWLHGRGTRRYLGRSVISWFLK